MPEKKKFRILAASDVHGDSNKTKKLAEKAVKEDVDLVILAGDLMGLVETNDILKPFIDKDKKEPRAGRIFGPIPKEIREKGYTKIAALAPEVI